MTKATVLKTIFLKKPLKNECRNMCHTFKYLFKTKIFFSHLFDPFLAFFSTLPNTQTIKAFGLFFFYGLKYWAMNMHFDPIHILQGLFLGGGRKTHGLRSPSIYRVNMWPLVGRLPWFMKPNQIIFCNIHVS